MMNIRDLPYRIIGLPFFMILGLPFIVAHYAKWKIRNNDNKNLQHKVNG